MGVVAVTTVPVVAGLPPDAGTLVEALPPDAGTLVEALSPDVGVLVAGSPPDTVVVACCPISVQCSTFLPLEPAASPLMSFFGGVWPAVAGVRDKPDGLAFGWTTWLACLGVDCAVGCR